MEMVKSMPVWRIAVPQVSPSIPTQAEAEPLPLGVGTVKVPVTDFQVPYKFNQIEHIVKACRVVKHTADLVTTAPAQFELYDTSVLLVMEGVRPPEALIIG